MTEVTIIFTFPGEGMNIDGTEVTPDTEQVGDEQLDLLPGYRENRQRVREARERRARERERF
jgi:hypothetical protein